MITIIRKTVKQSTSQVFIFFMFGAVVIGLIAPSIIKESSNSSTWAIKVNGREISYKAFVREMQMQAHWIAQMRQQYGQIADMFLQSMGMSVDPKTGAFDKLVKQELLDQYADKLGICVSADYISESVNNASFAQQQLGIPHFLYDQSGMLQKDMLENYLKYQSISAQEFEQMLEQALKRYVLIQLIASTDYVPQFDLIQEFVAHKLGKSFSYLHFSLDTFLKEEKKRDITQQELQSFFDAENSQRRRYFVPEKRDGYVWRFEPSSYGITISDEEIAQYYDSNKVRLYIDKPVTVHVRQITEKQLQGSGKTIEEVQEMLLQDASSEWSKKWINMEPIIRGEKSGAIENAAFLLKKEGDISPIIETDNGKVLLQLIKRTERIYKPLLSVKGEIVDALTDKKFKASFVADLKKAATEGKSAVIEKLIEQKKGKKERLEKIEKSNDPIAHELFALKKNGYGFFVDGSVGVAVQLIDKTEQYLPTLDSIKDVVQNDLYYKRAQDALYAAVQNAQKAAEEGAVLNLLQKEFLAHFEHVAIVRPNDTKEVRALEKKGLPIRTILGVEKAGSLLVHRAEKDTFLIKIDEIEAFDEEVFSANEKEIRQQMEKVRGNQQREAFVASLHKNATIETNNSVYTLSEEYSE